MGDKVIRKLHWPLGEASLELVQGDITRSPAQAVVNAANAHLRGGGGVDGAIHRAAGPQLLEACQKLIAERGKPLDPGEAVATPGFDMPAAHVIHTAGPVWRGGAAGEEQALRGSWESSLELARELGATQVAFPAISCGVYGYPVEQASRVALDTVRLRAQEGQLQPVQLVSVYLFDRQLFDIWAETAQELLGQPAG